MAAPVSSRSGASFNTEIEGAPQETELERVVRETDELYRRIQAQVNEFMETFNRLRDEFKTYENMPDGFRCVSGVQLSQLKQNLESLHRSIMSFKDESQRSRRTLIDRFQPLILAENIDHNPEHLILLEFNNTTSQIDNIFKCIIYSEINGYDVDGDGQGYSFSKNVILDKAERLGRYIPAPPVPPRAPPVPAEKNCCVLQ